ncbi:hypothetical protein [Thermoplasma sp.]|uniref:hypothetical protein n=1 Tax=Thermoplasma sp. TaxID=1973142 RepID=UPI0026319429|nr:hypothetical protein [Thermoplasma sp.]
MKLKSLSKDDQSRIKKRFQDLFSDPERIIPELLDSSIFCPIESYRKKIRRMKERGDFSYSGSDSFLSAISETFSAIKTDIPIMGVLKTPYGSLSYVKRGNVDDRVLAGVQNWDNDVWRMFSFYNLVMSKNLRIFSSKNYYLASCRGAPPPVEFIQDALSEDGIRFEILDSSIHIGRQDPSFTITIMSAVRLVVHADSKYRTGFSLLRHMLMRNPQEDIDLTSDFLDCAGSDDRGLLGRYLSGDLDDRHLLDQIVSMRKSKVIRSGYYGIGSTCYDSLDSFISAIDGAQEYAEFLRDYGSGIYLESPSLAKLMEIVWPDIGDRISETVIGKPSRSFAEMVAARSQAENEVKLDFIPWSEDSRFLADLIRAYRSNGLQPAVMEMKDRAKNHVQRSILYAFTVGIGGTSVGYLFDDDDRKLGMEISDYVRGLANSENVDENIRRIRAYIP